MNPKTKMIDKVNILRGLIKDAEWHVGNYIVCTDDLSNISTNYVEEQKNKIKKWREEIEKLNETLRAPKALTLQELRELVWNKDIPHPTTTEYKEHHESIQEILQAIDLMIDEEEATG